METYKVPIPNLVIETTRKCNMACEHCLRGDAQSLDMPKETICQLLNQVNEIGHVTFSGGEPSLAVNIIEYFLEQCKQREIELGWFYIATNGLNISESFIITCLKLYAYSNEKEMCLVQVSNDGYHAYENSYNTELLDGLSFFERKFKKEASYEFKVVTQGRGIDIGESDVMEHEIVNTADWDEAEIYLNCKGNIINGCDWSYESQDEEKRILCNVKDLTKFYLGLEESVCFI